VSGLDDLDARYTTILCDIWGVVHDGGRLLPGAKARLARWRDEGRKVVLVTNAPRPAERVEWHLASLGLPRDHYHAVTSSGAAGIAALSDPVRPVGFMGTAFDRADLAAHGIKLANEGFSELACTGLDEWRDNPGDYADDLARWAEADVLFHCLNPDRVVLHQGAMEACAGALADAYEALGGRVAWYGKPEPAIYAHALKLAGSPSKDSVVAVGDSLQTDMLGAARFGIEAIYVSHGIHAGQPMPDDFASRHGLAEWQPLMTVQGLG
jgi:HAD superfamily hydrolase (TIGR01450 family)